MCHEALTPEVISDNIHNGLGTDSVLAAAKQWQLTIVELDRAANAFREVIGMLAEDWDGRATRRMAGAIAPLGRWLGKLERRAAQVHVALEHFHLAYKSACANTVHPNEITANREQLHQLMADSASGLNAEQIADLQQQYQEFWARDVEAMRKYRDDLHRAVKLVPVWETPPKPGWRGYHHYYFGDTVEDLESALDVGI